MIYQPRNVQPSGISIDGLLNNTFTMEVQTNSYVSAYQLLVVDFDNNEVYTGNKEESSQYAYNGDILEIPVDASVVALQNGTNYKWRVRLYQPNADMLITYGLVQKDGSTTNITLQPNINIKSGMAITINGQTKTISSYNIDTGVAVVNSAFASAPTVGTQYKIYSDFIETIPDYIVYARQTPAVAISNVPSSLTLKYHTFQGTYTQSDNVAIVYHQFDLYTRNDDGTISLVNSSGKVYSANLSYTYDSFRTGNKYLIQMTVENDMGIISTTDMYEFTVSYDIVEYLQQPLATFDDKNNAVQVSWVTPVENEATSLRSDAATGVIQDNNNTLTQATFEPGQSIGEGDVVQITNSDCELVIDGKSTQKTRSGKNLFNVFAQQGYLEINKDNVASSTDWQTSDYIKVKPNTTYVISSPNTAITRILRNEYDGSKVYNATLNRVETTNGQSFTTSSTTEYIRFSVNSGTETKVQLEEGSTATSYEPYGASPSPDYPSEIESVGYENLFKPTLVADDGKTIIVTNATIGLEDDTFVFTCKNGTDMYFGQVAAEGAAYSGAYGNLIDISNMDAISYYVSNSLFTKNFVTYYDKELVCLKNVQFFTNQGTIMYADTPSGTKYISFRFGVGAATIGETYRTKVQIEKGSMKHSYIPYGKTGIEVKTVGKNLLELVANTSSLNGLIPTINNDGSLTFTGTTTANWSTITKLVNVDIPSGTYTLSNNKSVAYNIVLRVIYEDGTAKSFYLPNKSISNTIEFAQKVTKLRIGLEYLTDGGSYNETLYLQLEKGNTATKYEKYKSNTTVLSLNEPLRSLPNGVKDIAYIKNNKLYVDRYVGSVILNGTEGWNMNAGVGFHSPLLQGIVKNLGSGISNKYIYTDLSWQGNYTFSINSTGILAISDNTCSSVEEFKTWLSQNNVQVDYELATPTTEELGDSAIPYIDGINYMYISSNMDTTFSLVYLYKTISGNTYDYIEFNPPGVKQTGTIKSYNAITGVGTLMSQYPFTYSPIQGDSYAVISNIYNISGFSYLYNTPYNTVNSLYTHGYTATWATPDGLCVLPDDFNITLQFSPDSNFYYTDDGVYQEIVNLITTETDDVNNRGEFAIKIDKNKLIFTQQSEDGGSIVWDGNTDGKVVIQDMLYKVSDIIPSKTDLIGNKLILVSPDEVKTFDIVAEDDGTRNNICTLIDMDDSGNYAIVTLLPVAMVIQTPTTDFPTTGVYFISYEGLYVSELSLGGIVLETPFYTHTNQVFVLSSANIAQINNDYVWDDTANWTDTYTWVEGGTSLERVCNHWWKVQITKQGIKIEEIFPTT